MNFHMRPKMMGARVFCIAFVGFYLPKGGRRLRAYHMAARFKTGDP